MTTELKKGALTLFGAIGATCAFMGPATSAYFNTTMGIQNTGNAFGFAFLIATIATLFVAFAISQFARKIPTAGFAYTFSTHGIGPKSGFLTGWLLIGGYTMVAPLLLAAIGYFLNEFFKIYFQIDINWGIFAVVIAAVILVLSCLEVKQSVRIALILLLIEIGVMVIFFATILVNGGAEGISFMTFSPASALESNGLNGIGTAVMWAITMFIGFESAATLGEETKDPKKNIPKALIFSVVGIGIFFLLSAFSAVNGYGPSNVSSVVENIGKGNNPWDPLYAKYWGLGASVIVRLVILNSIFANLLAGFNAVVRIYFSMGREKVFPEFLGKVSEKRRVPVNANIVYMIISLGMALILGYIWGPMTVYGWTGTVLGLIMILVYIIINVSLFLYYKRKTNEFNFLKHVIVPLIATIILLLPLKGVISSTLPSGGGAAPMTSVPYFVGIWLILGIVYTIYLNVKRKDIFKGMGRAFDA